MIDTKELREKITIKGLDVVADTDVLELLDRLEAAEKELAELRSSMKFRTSLLGRTEAERDALCAKIEAAENDAAHQKALVESALRVAEGWERKCDALRAKIEQMERQEPVAWLHETRRDSDVVTDAVKHVWGRVAVGSMAAYSIPLYALPGAKGE